MIANTTPTLRCKPVPWPERKTALVGSWREIALEKLLAVALAHDVRNVLLIAGPYAAEHPPRDYWLAPASAGWTVSNYIGDKAPQARYTLDGATVDVRTTAPWFGHDTDAARVARAWQSLGNLVRGTFDRGATLMGTPARTGLDLLQRSLPDRGIYPVAPDDERRLMLANAGQGRFEFLPTETRRARLTWLDGRWMYAACVTNMPRGELRHDRTHAYIEHIPAFYFVRWRAPLGWPYPFGLLPELTGAEDGLRFRYPRDNRWHCGWITGAEFELARNLGWELRVSERIAWDLTAPDPLVPWANRLKRMRTYASDELVQGATRRLLIDAIGAFARQARRELHITPLADASTIPDDASNIAAIGDTIEWYREAPLSRDLAPFQHPEWAWQVWGRARARLVKTAIRYLDTTPGGEIAALRSDALIVTRPPAWEDDGKIGTFRVKRQTGMVNVPDSEGAYRELLRDDVEED